MVQGRMRKSSVVSLVAVGGMCYVISVLCSVSVIRSLRLVRMVRRRCGSLVSYVVSVSYSLKASGWHRKCLILT